MKNGIRIIIVFAVLVIGSSFTSSEKILPPCDEQDIVLSDIVFVENRTVQVSRLVVSAQIIVQNSNLIYKSGSGTVLSFGMTGSLTGPSQGFQIFSGSSLTVEIENCPNP